MGQTKENQPTETKQQTQLPSSNFVAVIVMTCFAIMNF